MRNIRILRLRRNYFPMTFLTLEIYQCKTEDEVIAVTKDADAVLNQYAPVSRKVIEKNDKNVKSSPGMVSALIQSMLKLPRTIISWLEMF